ncbi:MAG: SpoIIE family protein phosphatase [Thermoflexales bacterium]|nr:SpoIIE family protein phosphatase [Thermoflexales bacterium]
MNGAQPARWTIGFLTAHFEDFRFYGTWTGIAEVVRERGANLICFPVQDIASESGLNGNMAAVLGDLITPARIDGLITHQWWSDQAWFERICNRYRPLPIATIFRQYPGYLGVQADNYQGMRTMLSHLIKDHGYRRIAYIRGPEGTSADERYRAYTDALQHYHIPFDAKLVVSGDHTVTFAPTALRLLFEDRKLRPGLDVEAIVSSNDSMAQGVLEQLQLQKESGGGQDMPLRNGMGVVGFDDERWASFTTPPLTTTAVSWYELGRKAAEALLDLLEGKEVPESILTPTHLVIRRSCGCVPQNVRRAAAGPAVPISAPFDAAMAERHEAILAALQRAGGSCLPSPDWAERLLDAFVTDVAPLRNVKWDILNLPTSGVFLPTLETMLSQLKSHERYVEIGHNILSELRRQLLPVLASHPRLQAYVEDMWQQSRVVINNLAYEAQMRKQAALDVQAELVRELGQRLISTFDVMALMDTLVTGLSRLGFPGAYLATYEDPHTSMEWARLILAYNQQGRITLEREGQRFPSADLLPEDLLLHEHPASIVIEPLYFGHEQLGFILFEMGPRDGKLYAVLRGEISSALQGALLVERIQAHTAEIARKNYILDTFMESIPDSIYFKDRESCFTRANQALAQLFGVGDPAELIGKSDFDFFVADQAQPKYDQEQAIVRTGQALLNLEEPDAGGRWASTTKMPLRDEHGVIIGTFGISRDITELKHTQLALEQAYANISTLNAQLQEENVRMKVELDVVKRLQQMILPRPQELANIPGLEIVGYMRPADEVGGDYYDVLHHNGVLHIGIGDVTGHDLESGVVMLMTQAAIRALIEHGETNPIKFVNTLNRLIYKNIERMGTDKNLTFALVQYQGGHFKLVGQHEELLIVRQGGQVERMDTLALGFPVGLEPRIDQWVKSATTDLHPGDSLVLYTDGVIEAANELDELYGLDRLCAVLSTHWSEAAEAIKQAVVADVMAHIGTQKVYDDLTLVVLKQR